MSRLSNSVSVEKPKNSKACNKEDTNVERITNWKVYEGILPTCDGKVFVSYLLYTYIFKCICVKMKSEGCVSIMGNILFIQDCAERLSAWVIVN